MSVYKPCLVIVFNHRFDKNIEKLEKLYASRFENIFFLIPFYTGDNPRVIPVYESSFYFQGYIAQGYSTFYNSEFTHYFFIGDDLILNPKLNENNYSDLLKLNENTSYIPDICTLNEPAQSLYTGKINQEAEHYWWHASKAVTFYTNRGGNEIKNEIPSPSEAKVYFDKHNLFLKPLSYYNLFGPINFPSNIYEAIEISKKLWTFYRSWRHFKLPGNPQLLHLEYPLVYSYSDIVIVSSTIIKKFCHLCGVFSAMGLFVEMAIPTALVLSGGDILTDATLGLKGKATWGAKGIDAMERKYAFNLDELLDNFPNEQLYYHPIKLSRWHSNII